MTQNSLLNDINLLFSRFLMKLDEMSVKVRFRFLFNTFGFDAKRCEIDKKTSKKGT